MLKGPIALASFGLARNLVLWGIPGMVAASGAALQVAVKTYIQAAHALVQP